MKTKTLKNWVLLENGYVHTDKLTKSDALEMLERHARIFPNIDWNITQR